MDFNQQIYKIWFEKTKANNAELIEFIKSDLFNKGHYLSYLRETYFHTRENPFSQVMAASYFPRDEHSLFKKFISHALSEVGHNLLALNDFLELGGKIGQIKNTNPLNSTTKLINFTFEIANSKYGLKYLGYLYHVEMMPVILGRDILQILKDKIGSGNFFTFLEEHMTVDIQHQKFMDQYLTSLIKSEADLNLVLEGLIESVTLFNDMMNESMSAPLIFE